MKRGILLKTIELVFSAVLFLAFVYLLVTLIQPIIAGEHPGARDDLEYTISELKDLKNGEKIPIVSTHVNYTISFFAPRADKPGSCDRSACVCVFDKLSSANNLAQPIQCEKIAGFSDTCAEKVRCFAEPVKHINKPGPNREEFYLCQDTNGQVKITKNIGEC